MPAKILILFFSGGCGVCLRFLVVSWLQKPDARSFPYGTLAVNLAGCALIGCAMAWFASHEKVRPEHQLAVTVGLLGGFTTFSAFGYETFRLVDSGAWAKAAVYVALSNVVGVALAAGMYLLAWRAASRG